MSTSSRSNSRSVWSTMAAQFSGAMTSAMMRLHFAPESHSSFLSWLAASSSLSTKTGTAPSRAHPRTMAAPIPFPPPVTRTTLSLSCKSTFRRFQLIEVRRVAAEDFVLDVERKVLDVVFDDFEHLLVSGRKQAYRPI